MSKITLEENGKTIHIELTDQEHQVGDIVYTTKNYFGFVIEVKQVRQPDYWATRSDKNGEEHFSIRYEYKIRYKTGTERSFWGYGASSAQGYIDSCERKLNTLRERYKEISEVRDTYLNGRLPER